MIINISKKVKIENPIDWYNVAPPKGEEKQWKEGRSALEMARFATSNEFETMIKNVLKDCKTQTQDFECEPEALTVFPSDTMGTSGPRNHDLLMIGKNCVIGVEAKVSESFDILIKDKRINASENMKKRLSGAINFIYGDKVPFDVEDMHYQLFSATVGTVLEAQKHKECKNAIILVLVFKGDVCKATDPSYDNNVKVNNEAFKKFYDSVHVDNTPEGLIKIASAGDINCWLKKIEVEVENRYKI